LLKQIFELETELKTLQNPNSRLITKQLNIEFESKSQMLYQDCVAKLKAERKAILYEVGPKYASKDQFPSLKEAHKGLGDRTRKKNLKQKQLRAKLNHKHINVAPELIVSLKMDFLAKKLSILKFKLFC